MFLGCIPCVFGGFLPFSEWARGERFWAAPRTAAPSQWRVNKNPNNPVTACSWPSWASFPTELVQTSPLFPSLLGVFWLPEFSCLPVTSGSFVHLFLVFRVHILLSPFQFDHINLIFCLSELKLDYSQFFFSKRKSFLQEVTWVELVSAFIKATFQLFVQSLMHCCPFSGSQRISASPSVGGA